MYTLAYVTYQDIRSIQTFQEQIVIAIKAPEETKLEIPIPKEVSFAHFPLLREQNSSNVIFAAAVSNCFLDSLSHITNIGPSFFLFH